MGKRIEIDYAAEPIGREAFAVANRVTKKCSCCNVHPEVSLAGLYFPSGPHRGNGSSQSDLTGGRLFEFEVGFESSPISELPHAAISRFAETGRCVAFRSVIRRTGHCSGCAMPACYANYEFHSPRPDMKCRRCRDGIRLLLNDDAAVDCVARLIFRKWAKLQGQGTTKLHTKADAVRYERRNARLGHSLNAAPMPFGVKVHAIRSRARMLDRNQVNDRRLQRSSVHARRERPTAAFVRNANAPSVWFGASK